VRHEGLGLLSPESASPRRGPAPSREAVFAKGSYMASARGCSPAQGGWIGAEPSCTALHSSLLVLDIPLETHRGAYLLLALAEFLFESPRC